MVRNSIFICAILFISLCSFSEDLVEKTARKVCVYTVSDISGGVTQKDESLFKDSIRDNLILELKVAGFYVLDEKAWRTKQKELAISDNDLFEGPVAIRLAERAEADVAVTGFLMLTNKKILFGIKCYDVKAKRLAATAIKSGKQGLAVMSLINEAIAEIIPKIKKAVDIYTVKEGEIEKEVTVFKDITLKEIKTMGSKVFVTLLSQDEDADVYLANQLAGRIKDGKITFDANADSTLYVRLSKPEYYDSFEVIKVAQEETAAVLKPLYKSSFMLNPEIQYTLFQFIGIGLGLRYYIETPWFDLTDWTFLNLNNYLFFQLDTGSGSNPVIHNDINLTANQYILMDPSSFFRFGVFMGTGIVFTFYTHPNMPVFSDYYIDVFGGWFELNFTGLKVYFRFAMRMYVPFFDLIKNDIMGIRLFYMGPVQSIGVVLKW